MLLSFLEKVIESVLPLNKYFEKIARQSFSLEQLRRILATDNAHTHANAVNQN
jgi:hypothetical protein